MLPTNGDPIISGLRRHLRARRPLDLLNVYKGAPIVYSAAITEVEAEAVGVRIATFHGVCLSLEPTTVLLSQWLEEAVSARVQAVDLATGKATLTQFQYANAHVGDRMTVRVAPAESVDVRLEIGDQVYTGPLVDVSISGLGVHLPVELAANIRPRAVVKLTVALPRRSSEAPLQLSGTVRFVKAEGSLIRVGVVFIQEAQVLMLLHYVRERQNQIIDELQGLYRAQRA